MQSKGQGRISAQTNVSASPNNSIKKSLRNIREKSHQEFYTNRAAKLGNIFTQNGFDLDSLVTEDEVLTFLDTLGKEPFNREIATQLFEKLPFQESGNSGDFRRFILRDFIDMHIKAEYLLLIRAEEIEGELDTVYNQIEGLRDQFVEVAKKSEARIENNTLQADIVEVVCDDEEYQAEIGSVFSVIVVVGNYKYETDEIIIDQPKFNPKFNWTFHFKFDTPDEKMQILLRDQKRFGADDDYTDLKCTINLKNYRDQIKHVTWLTLYNAYQQPTKFKVHLDIQWQFSKLAFHEEKFGELQVLEEKLNEEKEYIETSIKLLVHPFAFASSSKTRGVSQGFKSDPNVRMTQSIPGDMIGTRQTVHESYSQSKDQPQTRLAQSYYSEQNAPYNKQPSIESNKSSGMLPEGNSRVAESLQSSKNPSELAMSDKKARVTQSYQSSTQPFQLGQNANVVGDFRKTSQGNTPVMPVLGGGNMASANQSRHYVQSYPPEQNSASGSEGFRKLETFSAQGNTPVMPVLGGGNMASANQSRHYVQSFQAEQNVVNVEGGGFRKLETFSSQGNTPVMPVLGGGNMASANQSRHYVQSYPPEQNSASVGEGGFRKMETFSAQGNSPVIPVLGGGNMGSANQSRNYSQNYQPTQPYQPYQQEQGGLQKLGTFSAQGNTPVMPVLGGGNMGSANQSRHYGGIGGGFSPQVNSPYRQPSDASETSIKRITAKNPFENPALDYKGTKLVPQTTGNFGAFGGDRPVGADPLRRMPSNQSEKSMRSAEAAVGIQPKRFENVKSGNQSRDQAELRGDMQAGQSYMSNQSGKANRVGSDPLRPEAMGYDQRGYRKNPSNFA